MGSPLVYLPCIPRHIRLRIGIPIPPDKLFGPPDTPPTDDRLRKALVRVEATVQELVNLNDGR